MTRRSTAAGVAVCAFALTACDPPPTGWSIEAVSVTADGTITGNGAVNAYAISPDGTKVAFETLANNLGASDGNGTSDIYVRDLTSGATRLVSTNSAGTSSSNARSLSPTFSPDGSSVAFTSWATDMDPDDRDGEADLYVAELGTGDLRLVTPGPSDCGPGNAETPVFSPDGSHIAYVRRWTSIGYWDTVDLYVHDLANGSDTPVTRTSPGTSCINAGVSSGPVFSADGSTLAFVSTSRLVAEDQFFQADIYVRDMTAGSLSLVSVNGAGTNSMGTAATPAVSPSGTLVAFRSSGTDLGPTDSNASDDIYVRDLASGTTALGSAAADGTAAGGVFGAPAFDSTGRRVAFSTSSNALGPVDTNGFWDVYVHDLATGSNALVSVNGAGTDSGRGISGNPAFLTDDRIVFQSSASDLGPPDAGVDQDVYARDVSNGTTTLLSRNPQGTDGGNGDTSWIVLSGDRTTVGMMTLASNLGVTDGNGARDLFVVRYRPSADLQLAVTGGAVPVPPGGVASLHATLSNRGPDAAESAAMAVLVPDGVTVDALSPSFGTCDATPAAGGIPVCTFEALVAGGTVTVDIDVLIDGGLAADEIDVTLVTASTTSDPQPAGGTVTVTIDVDR